MVSEYVLQKCEEFLDNNHAVVVIICRICETATVAVHSFQHVAAATVAVHLFQHVAEGAKLLQLAKATSHIQSLPQPHQRHSTEWSPHPIHS